MNLILSELSYIFPENQVHALNGISLNLEQGKIYGLLGENGAGKSTLARLCTGHLAAHSGEIRMGSRVLDLRSPQKALKAGLCLIPQHPELACMLDLGENMFLSSAYARKPFYTKKRRSFLEKQLAFWDLHLALNTKTSDLSAAEIHWLSLAQGLSNKLEWLFLDEPSAAFDDAQIKKLYEQLRKLSNKGLGIVVITHRIREITEYADASIILSQGRLKAQISAPLKEKHNEIYERMFSQQSAIQKDRAELNFPAPGRSSDKVLFQFNNLHIKLGRQRNLNLRADFFPGRIHGILGHRKQGLEALEEILSLAQDRSLLFLGKPLKENRQVLGYIPSRRFQKGIVQGLSIKENYFIRNRSVLFSGKNTKELLEAKKSLRLAENKNWEDPIETLSGGMIQKVILSREMYNPKPNLLVCAEPWWGLDVKAQEQFTQELKQLAAEGLSILILSSDIDEIQALCTDAAILSFNGLSQFYDCSKLSREAWVSLYFGQEIETA